MVIVFAGILAVLFFLLQRKLYREYWKKRLLVDLSFERDIVREGAEVCLYETVENNKWLPISAMKVKFQCSRNLRFSDSSNSQVTDQYYRNDLFTLMPYRRILRKHQITCMKRGFYPISHVDLVGVDLFFSQEMMTTVSCDHFITVLPKQLPPELHETAVKKILGDIATKRYELSDPFTFRGIREYEIQDDPRSINWRATAKTDELKVNMQDYTALYNVRIMMNLADTAILRREELLEMCIRLGNGITGELLTRGIRVSLYSNAADCISKQPLRMANNVGVSAMGLIERALARLDVDTDVPRFHQHFAEMLSETGDSQYTIFISADTHEDFQNALITYQRSHSGQFIWLCPHKNLEEPKVKKELVSYCLPLKEITHG